MDRETGRAHGTASAPRIHRDSAVGEAARLLSRSGAGALMAVDGHAADATVVGLLTEHDFPAIGVASSPRERMRTFCERKVDHIALMDGFRVSAILSIWDCAGAAGVAAAHA